MASTRDETVDRDAFSSQPQKALFQQSFARLSEEAEPGGYYGPTGFQDMKGPVDRAWTSRAARDEGRRPVALGNVGKTHWRHVANL